LEFVNFGQFFIILTFKGLGNILGYFLTNSSGHPGRELRIFMQRVADGIFSNRKSQFGQILECVAMKDVDKLYIH
jgi:hypothetical protein